MDISTRHGNLTLGKKTILMGVLNITPDSFYDGGRYFSSTEKAVRHVKQMLEEGADIIDIGGESTASYTGAKKITAEEELARVIPMIIAIRKNLGREVVLSIDTYKSVVAKEAVAKGVDIINDPSGLQMDDDMVYTVAQTGAIIIINHMQGNPKTMFLETIQHKDVIKDISDFFDQKIALLEKLGVQRDRIILDPGFGFRKGPRKNIDMLKRLGELKKFGLPIMIGISRKSTIGRILSDTLKEEFAPDKRLEGSLAATAIAVMNGADIVRTHDVWETKKFLAVLDRIKFVCSLMLNIKK